MANFHKDLSVNVISVSANPEGNFADIDRIDFSGCDVRMQTTFLGSSKLKSVLNANFNAVPQALFAGCENLSVLYNVQLNTNNFSDMFSECKSLQHLEMNMSGVTQANGAFEHCESLSLLNITLPELVSASSFASFTKIEQFIHPETINLLDGSFMFEGCTKLKSVELDIRSLRNMDSMFAGCSTLASLTFKNDCGYVENIDEIFGGVESGQTIIGGPVVSEFVLSGSSLKSASYAFAMNSIISSVNLGSCPNLENAEYMFNDCSTLTSVTMLDCGNMSDTNGMFNGCTALTDARVGGLKHSVSFAFSPLTEDSIAFIAENAGTVSGENITFASASEYYDNYYTYGTMLQDKGWNVYPTPKVHVKSDIFFTDEDGSAENGLVILNS